MFSNLRTGFKICRPCATSSSIAFLARSFKPVESSTSSRLSRGFSIDVASLIGEPPPIEQAPIRNRPKVPIVQPKPTRGSSGIPHWVQTPIDLLIFKAQNSNDLWNVASKYQLTGTQAVSFLVALAKFGANESVDFKEISSSSSKKPAFDAVVRAVTSELGTSPVGNTVLALRSVLALDFPADNEVVVELRKKLIKDFYLLGRAALVSFAIFHSKYADGSELGKELQSAIEKSLFDQLREISDPNDLLAIFTMARRENTMAIRMIEGKLLERINALNGDQLVRLLNILASKCHRSLPLLKSIANRYAHCEDDLPIKKLSSILSDLGVLHYPNLKMLTVLFRDIEAKVDTISKPAVIIGIFSSLAIMRLRCVQVLEALCAWTRKHLDAFTAEELASVLVVLARCNFVPVGHSQGNQLDLVTEISKKISRKKFENEKMLWLDTVWALAILERLPKEHVASVLDKTFYQELLNDLSGNDYKLLVAQMKLRNINTAARLEVQGYRGPFLDVAALKEMKEVNVSQYKEESVKLLTDALNNLAPRDKYMKTSVTTPEGYVIDALLRLTEAGKPVPVSQWDKPPLNSYPVAVVLRHFNETTLISDSPIGLHAMAARHLKALHHIVLEIPTSEIEQRRQSLARVQLLKEKLDAAIQNVVVKA